MPDVLESAFSGFGPHHAQLEAVVNKLIKGPLRDTELKSMLATQCEVLWDRFQSIEMNASLGYGPAAMVLFRSLAELSAGMLYLAKNDGRLQEFRDAGKKAFFEAAQHLGVNSKRLEGLRPEYEEVKRRYPKRPWGRGWHGLLKQDLFDKAGLNEAMQKDELYFSFYPDASDILHGGALLVTYNTQDVGWFNAVLYSEWETYCQLAMCCGYLMVIETLLRLDNQLNFGISEELREINRTCRDVAEKYLFSPGDRDPDDSTERPASE